MEFAVATHHFVIKTHNPYLTARNACETTRNYERRMKIRWRGMKMKHSVIVYIQSLICWQIEMRIQKYILFIKFN